MMKRYVNYLSGMADKNILSHGPGDWYDLRPEFPGEAQLTPKKVTATSFYFYDISLLFRLAEMIGEKEDAVFYGKLAEEVRLSFNNEFLNLKTKVYSTGSQTAYSMPLYFGIIDQNVRREVVSNLVKSINDSNKALTSGDIGYRYLLRVLEQEGQSQLIFDMNSKRDVPGYGFQLLKGATATINTINGEITSVWKIENNTLTMRIRIPVNCKSKIEIPQADPSIITESGIQLADSKYITSINVKEAKTICEISSGQYIFTVPYQSA